MSPKTIPIVWTLILVLGVLVTACGGNLNRQESPKYELAASAELPLDVQSEPEIVRTAYQFAFTNPDVLTQLPCYCGCSGMGHTSNYSCYVAGENSDGTLAFDGHALGCSICVDITVDAMRMLDEGKPMTEIRSFVDQTYSAFGPSNMPLAGD